MPGFKSMRGVTQASRKLIALNGKYNAFELASDYIKVPKVITTKTGTKINITTGLQVTSSDYAKMKKQGSFSLYDAYYYKKVYTSNVDQYNNPIPLQIRNSKTASFEYIYKLINVYGDGNRAVEMNTLLTPSQIDNGSIKIQEELTDAEIVSHFSPQIQEESLPLPTIEGAPIQEISSEKQLKENMVGQIKLNNEQQTAVDNAIDFINSGDPNTFFVIEGKAGTGKTTIAEKIVKAFPSKTTYVAALSHKAKSVIRNKFKQNKVNAYFESLASLLGQKLDMETGEFERKQNDTSTMPIEYADIIVIDEASMINEQALELIFDKKPSRAKVIFLGDIGLNSPCLTLSNSLFLLVDSNTGDFLLNNSFLFV